MMIQNSKQFHQLTKTMATNTRVSVLGALLLCLVTTGVVQAQTKTLTLDEAIKLGIESSKTLKLSQSKIDRAVAEFNVVKDKALPTGTSSLGYTRAQIPANTLNLGSTQLHLPSSADAFVGTAALQETVFGGYRMRYAQQSTDLLTQIARLDAVKDKDQITYDVISAFFNLYKVLQSQKVVAKNVDAVTKQLNQAQRFFDQGIVTKNDVLRFELQKSNIELNGIDLESNRKIINYNLDILLGLPETTELNIDEIAIDDRSVAPLSNYLDSAMTNRQELRQLDLQNKYAAINIKSITAEKLPNVGVGANLYYIDAQANPIPQYGNYILPITLGATVSWNFGSLWTNKHKVAEAKIALDETSINKSIVVDNLKNEVNRNYQSYLSARDKITLLQTSIDQAGENDKILESKYRTNVASATDRVDAETLLYQAQINLELAKADAGLAYYTLIKSTGKLNK